jgi:integrase
MPLKLIPPGTRKGNRFYLVRGQIAGQRVEVSTATTDKAAAQRFALALELRLREDRVPEPGEELTFARAADLYAAWKSPGKPDQRRVRRLQAAIGSKPVGSIHHADLVKAANDLYANRSAATKNREALRPAAAILHYAASQGYCGWLRVALFKEPRPKTRATTQQVARVLISGLDGKKRLLLLWLFRQGPRISDALKITGEQIDLERRTVTWHIGKQDRPDVVDPLHEEVWELLVNDPPVPGPLFPWRTKSGVYKWLRPYCKVLGIHFTPHMARHSLGKWLNEDGASLRQIMDTLHHDDVKSSARYQSTDIEVIRQTGKRLGKLV